MTFTDPQHPAPSAQDDTPSPRPRSRARARAVTAPVETIRTRLAPNCAWPTEADALPARRGKRR